MEISSHVIDALTAMPGWAGSEEEAEAAAKAVLVAATRHGERSPGWTEPGHAWLDAGCPPLNMCAHGGQRGTYCGHCRGYSQGSGMEMGLPTNETLLSKGAL